LTPLSHERIGAKRVENSKLTLMEEAYRAVTDQFPLYHTVSRRDIEWAASRLFLKTFPYDQSFEVARSKIGEVTVFLVRDSKQALYELRIVDPAERFGLPGIVRKPNELCRSDLRNLRKAFPDHDFTSLNQLIETKGTLPAEEIADMQRMKALKRQLNPSPIMTVGVIMAGIIITVSGFFFQYLMVTFPRAAAIDSLILSWVSIVGGLVLIGLGVFFAIRLLLWSSDENR
jgi:hypothetical protein